MTAAAITDPLDGRPAIDPLAGVTRTCTAILTARDVEMFARIGVPPALLEEAHIERVSNGDARERFGITGPPSKDMAGIVFPYYSHVTGQRVTARIRRDNPEIEDGKPKNKYVSAYGDGRHLYFPPDAQGKLQEPTMPIVLVEAEKSVLALTARARRTSADVLPVGLGGCWGWRGRIGKTESVNGERVDVEGPLPDLAVCDGRTVYLMLDSNVASNGKVQAARNALARELVKRGCTVRLCNLPQLEGVNGPDDYIAVRGDEALTAIFAEAVNAASLPDWPEPEPLQDALPDVAQFDLELMPESFRPLVKDVAERMQVPLDFPAVVAIATLAGVTNRRAVIQPKRNDDTWTVVPNLWGGIIAPPGMMKSPAIACITQPAHVIESEWRERYKDEEQAYNAALELQEQEVKAWHSKSQTALKRGQTRPAKPESSLTPPVLRRLITSDATFEALHAVLSENPAGILVLRDELTGWLAGLEKQGREQERAFYLEGWNGDGACTVDRIGRGSVHVPHVCISLFGGIQPARLRPYLADALRDGPSNDGLIQRFQLIVWPDVPHGWQYVDRKPDKDALEHVAQVYRRIAAMDAANPLRLQFDSEAQALFEQWLTDLERRIREDNLQPSMQAHLSKYRSLMPTLALLFALADGRTDCVSLFHAKLACAWCAYLETHANRVYASQARPEHQAAIALSRRLAKGWKREEGVFTVRDVYRSQWHMLDSKEATRGALLVLQEYGWVREEVSGDKNLGRPSETYRINPSVGRKHASGD